MQEFELVLQLGNIRSNGHHFVFALWKRGNMPPPLGGGLWTSFIFLRCRSPYRAWLFVHFSSLPRRKTNQKEGGAKREKNSACGLKQLFPRRETQKTASSQSARYKGHMHTRQGKESGLWLPTTFPGAGNAGGGAVLYCNIFYPLYKGVAGKPAGRSEFICKPCPFLLNKRGGLLDSGKAV